MSPTLRAIGSSPPSRPVLLGPQHSVQSFARGSSRSERGPRVLVAAGWEAGGGDRRAGEASGIPGREPLWPACEEAFEADHSAAMFVAGIAPLGRLYRVRLAAELEALRSFSRAWTPRRRRARRPALEPAFESLAASTSTTSGACGRSTTTSAPSRVLARSSPGGGRSPIGRRRDAPWPVGTWGSSTIGCDSSASPRLCPSSCPWRGGAGAMVLTDRILLFHDSPPQGPGDAESTALASDWRRPSLVCPMPRHALIWTMRPAWRCSHGGSVQLPQPSRSMMARGSLRGRRAGGSTDARASARTGWSSRRREGPRDERRPPGRTSAPTGIDALRADIASRGAVAVGRELPPWRRPVHLLLRGAADDVLLHHWIFVESQSPSPDRA